MNRGAMIVRPARARARGVHWQILATRFGNPPAMSNCLIQPGVVLMFAAALNVTASPAWVRCQAQEPVAGPQGTFRVVTDIFFGDQKQPAQQTLTLFSAGVAYDVSFDDPNQVTMVDPARDRIVLLNKRNQTQTTIDLQQLRQYIDSARKQAETSKLALYLSGADQIEVTGQTVRVGDQLLQYQATLQQPRDEQLAAQYARAADALSLLNGWRSGVPPFARLSLNRVVAEQKALPEEITRTTRHDKQVESVRCRLHTNWRLSKDDQRQIAEIGTLLVNYAHVHPTEFFAAIDQQTAAQAASKK